MSLTTIILRQVAKAATKGEISPMYIAKYIDRAYGDGDGVFEMSDVTNAVTTIASEYVDKAASLVNLVGASDVSDSISDVGSSIIGGLAEVGDWISNLL